MLTPRLYRLLSQLLVPLARLYLLKRARRQPAYREHWDERFASAQYPRAQRPRLWVHAVSVGETVAARPLIEAFLSQFDQAEVLLTHMTPTGRDVGQKLAAQYPQRITQCYLPYDVPAFMQRFLEQTTPTLGLIMETEVWPNLMQAAAERGLPMILANARESEKSYQQARKVIALMRPAFAGFSCVLAQSEADAERLALLGAQRIEVCGSVKFDIQPDGAQQRAARCLRERLDRPVVLLASTRQGEEKELVAALNRLAPGVLVVLVPRHPQRFDEVAELLDQSALRYVRKSACRDLAELEPSVRVLLGDTMGEMSFYCALSDVCVMGGSFGPYGCQNLIEPAAAHVPVIVGPSVFNFSKAVDDAVRMQAAVSVRTAEQALTQAQDWLSDCAQLQHRKQAAGAFAQAYTGATRKMMKQVTQLWQIAQSTTR